MSESINKTSQNSKKDQPTDENMGSQMKSEDDVTWADLEGKSPTKDGLITPSEDVATVEDLADIFKDVDDEDKVENYTQQE